MKKNSVTISNIWNKMRFGLAQCALAMSLGLGVLENNAQAAITCDDIMSMVGYNIPVEIIISTMESSGTRFSNEDIQCLQTKKAPAAVVAQAKKMSADAAVPVIQEEAPRQNIDGDDVEIRDVRGGSSDGDDLSEDEDSNDPKEIKDAIKLLRAQKPVTASYQLYALVAEAKYPDQESKIHYYLARALSDLEMYHSAQYYYTQVVKKGPADPYFNYALPKLVALSKFTGDDSDLERIAIRLPPDRYPRQAKNHLHYLLGVQNYKDGDLKGATDNFSKVSSKSSFYLQSRYIEGIILNEQEQYKSAVRAFRDVYREEVDIYNDPKELKRVNNLKDLSLINIASIYFGIARYSEASAYYQKLSRESDYWAESMFRDAWANIHMGELNVTLGKILTVESPYFAESDFIPEAEILKAFTYFQLCDWNKVERIIKKFEATYKPMRQELAGFLGDYQSQEQRKLADQAWDKYFSTDINKETTLPEAFFAKVLRNQDIAGIVSHMDLMEQELIKIDSEKPQWRDTIGVHLKKVIQEDMDTYKKRAGRFLLSEMQRQHDTLGTLLSQAQLIGFEVVDAQRVDYEYKASNLEALGDQSKFDVDFATSPDLIYWPFNGEFWADELGYYNYTEQSSCK